MKLVSWNVNGIRAVAKKGLFESIESLNPDVLCFQETKAQDDQVAEVLNKLDGFHLYSSSAVKKGYSGTAMLTKEKPLSITYGIGIEEHDQEGRLITAEFENYYLLTCYVPNSKNDLSRLDYREGWDEDLKNYMLSLETKKPVILCGDLNVAHKEIDLKNPKPNYNKSAGFTQREIDGLSNILSAGYVDSFRYLKPEEVKYSWWSYRAAARERNVGWRIDYFVVSETLKEQIKTAEIHNDIHGSDHCPVSIEI